MWFPESPCILMNDWMVIKMNWKGCEEQWPWPVVMFFLSLSCTN
jgi:hypothetical protein